ncbi:MAG: hypothetical protein LBB94_06320, partial [Clostridiales bacterium]|nr:hypothetical protein [Clostridiales bacterium]
MKKNMMACLAMSAALSVITAAPAYATQMTPPGAGSGLNGAGSGTGNTAPGAPGLGNTPSGSAAPGTLPSNTAPG